MSDEPAEEMEFIPWSQLVGEDGPSVPRLVYVGAAAVLALAAGLMLGPRVWPAVSAAEEPVPTTTTTTSATPVSPTPSAAVATPVVETDVPWEVVAMAEVFVQDYFTRDGDPNRADDLSQWGLEHEAAETTSYVEWAKALSTEDVPGGWEVDVAFRSISNRDTGFVRDPIQVVRVTLDANNQIYGYPHLGSNIDLFPIKLPVTAEPSPELLVQMAERGSEYQAVGMVEPSPGRFLAVVQLPGGALVQVDPGT